MDAGIYGIKNKNNGELIYVGSSVIIDIRIKQHLNCIKNEQQTNGKNKIVERLIVIFFFTKLISIK